MATERRPLVVGNWKMNGLRASNAELLKVLDAAITIPRRVEVAICPPATLIAPFSGLARGSRVKIGAQDCHPEASGAFTGDISAEMLADAGASFVIVGHSERRLHNAESDGDVRLKALAAWRATLTPIICIGETKGDRDAKETLDVIGQQLGGSLPNGARGDNLVIAYEPIWAIGTGATPTVADIAEVNGFIRKHLTERYGPAGTAIRILYGGSVKPDNAKELLAAEDVDGALVGGASLKAEDFLGIIAAYS